MSNREFTATRTMLANAFATAGAELLDYMGTAAALAAIPNTDPPRYVVAGTLAMIAKVLPSADAPAAATVLTDERIDELFAPVAAPVTLRAIARAIEREVLAHVGVTAEPVDQGHVLRTLRRMLDGGQPKDISGALMVIDNALKNGIAWSYDIAAPQGFISYVKANYYGDVHFHDPEWHATRLWNAAMKNAGARIPTIPGQVPAAEVRAALEMARSYIDATSTEPGYGFARPDNPHDFHPDAESCSADEIAAHKAACDAYDKGEYTPERGSEWVGAMHILRAPWGIGTYTMRDEQAVKVLAAIDIALAQQSTADKASEVRAAEWISVEDRLPEEGATVLTTGPNYGAEGRGYWFQSAKHENGWFDFSDAEDEEHYQPTHWMPLPQPPKEAQ